MSVSYNIGDFKDIIEYEKKERQYKQLLKIQAKLNDDYEKAFQMASNAIQIQPVPEKQLSPEEMRKNLILQRQQLTQKLQGITTAEEIVTFLNNLPNDQLVMMNQHFSGYEKALKWRKNLTSAELSNTWSAYSSSLTSGGLERKDVNEDALVIRNLNQMEKILSTKNSTLPGSPLISPENAQRLVKASKSFEEWLVTKYLPTLTLSIPSFAEFYSLKEVSSFPSLPVPKDSLTTIISSFFSNKKQAMYILESLKEETNMESAFQYLKDKYVKWFSIAVK
jgi:hypothetical protein